MNSARDLQPSMVCVPNDFPHSAGVPTHFQLASLATAALPLLVVSAPGCPLERLVAGCSEQGSKVKGSSHGFQPGHTQNVKALLGSMPESEKQLSPASSVHCHRKLHLQPGVNSPCRDGNIQANRILITCHESAPGSSVRSPCPRKHRRPFSSR